jgi:hypothetical protein
LWFGVVVSVMDTSVVEDVSLTSPATVSDALVVFVVGDVVLAVTRAVSVTALVVATIDLEGGIDA